MTWYFSSTNSKPYICWQHVKSKKEWMVALVEKQRKLLWTFMLKTPTTHTWLFARNTHATCFLRTSSKTLGTCKKQTWLVWQRRQRDSSRFQCKSAKTAASFSRLVEWWTTLKSCTPVLQRSEIHLTPTRTETAICLFTKHHTVLLDTHFQTCKRNSQI